MAALEIADSSTGVVYVDKLTGDTTVLVTGISRLDQIALHPSGEMWVTREVGGPATSQRLFRMIVGYDGSNTPTAVGTSLATLITSQNIDNPEGLVVLETAGAFGNAGDLYVTSDRDPGGVFRVEPGTGTTTLLSGGLARPEGLAFGTFGGQAPAALYVAVTLDNVVARIEADGTTTPFGNPAAVNLTSPDNLEFGPDGFLYISEDRDAPDSRLIRVAVDGTHTVYATGFGTAEGMIFDADGDLCVAEQDLNRIWRVDVPDAGIPVPSLGIAARFSIGLLLMMISVAHFRKRQPTLKSNCLR